MVVLLISLTFVSNACFDPLDPTVIENKTNQNLSIFLNDEHIGDVAPGRQIRNKTLLFGYAKYVVQAKNDRGEIVYSKVFTYEEMKQIKWKVVVNKIGE